MASSICFISIALFFMVIWTSGCISHVQWVRLTQHNFSSDIHNHAFVVTIATVPWCGESRSIMKELAKCIGEDQSLYPVVQLRVIYVNLDKDLGLTVIGRKKTPVITMYLNAIRFQYKGALKIPNILAAMHRGLTISSGHPPFRRIESISDIENLLKSTETAVMLYDLCNYAEKLDERNWPKLVKKSMEYGKKFNQESSFTFPKEQENEHFTNIGKAEILQPNIHEIQLQQSFSSRGGDVSQEEDTLKHDWSSRIAVADKNDLVISKRKSETFLSGNHLDGKSDFLGIGSSKGPEAHVNEGVFSRTCGTSLLEYLWENNVDILSKQHRFEVSTSYSYPISDSHSCASFNRQNQIIRNSCDQICSCNHTDYKHFSFLYQNLSRIARAHVLTPEYVDFGIIRDKHLVLDLGIGKMPNFTWFLMVQTMAQPNTPKIYLETEIMESAISDSMRLVPELNRDNAKHYSSSIEVKPCVVLFIDRASPSLEIRTKSWDALRAIVSIATDGQKLRSLQEKDIHSDPKESSAKKIIIKSIDGSELFNTIADLKASLNYGTLANNVLKPTIYQPAIIEDNLSGTGESLHQEVDKRDTTMVLKVLLGDEKIQMEESLLKMSETFQGLGIKEALFSESNFFLNEVQDKKHSRELDFDNVPSFFMDMGSQKIHISSKIDDADERGTERLVNLSYLHLLSYFRVDGDDSIKDMFLRNASYPSLVILDPSEGGHFVFPVDQSISYSSIKEFIYQFSRGSLKRVYNSGPEPQRPRKQVRPPFVNRDFHEMNGVPWITVETLSEMLGTSQGVENDSDLSKRGILVHFTLSACGFCKKMELIFREVHQLLTLHMDAHLKGRCMRQNGIENQVECVTGTWAQFPDKASCAYDRWREWKYQLPILFQIDCTTNDCSLFFKDMYQELYPSILLFIPGRKAKFIFDGGPSVQQLLEFIFHQGSIDIEILHMLHGALRWREEMKFQTVSSVTSPLAGSVRIDSRMGPAPRLYHFTTNAAEGNPLSRSLGTQSENIADINHEATSLVYPKVGSVLVATKKLNANISKVFENSRIWIVKADEQEGFQGLILNKPLSSWELLLKLVDNEIGEFFNHTVICYGGPVIVNGQPFVSITRLKGIEGYLEVIPGIYFGGTLATMQVLQLVKEAKNLDVTDYWFFLGHSAWSWQQLLDEIEENLWQLNNYEEDFLSGTIQEWQNSSYLDISHLVVINTMSES